MEKTTFMPNKNYSLDSIYVAMTIDSNKKYTFLEQIQRDEVKYKRVFQSRALTDENDIHLYTEKQLRNKMSLEEFLIQENMDILLYDHSLNRKNVVSTAFMHYVETAFRDKYMMEESRRNLIHRMSIDTAKIVSDLMGLNATTNPMSPFPLKEEIMSNIKEVAISAKKQKKFIDFLQQYIEICLYAEKSLTITKDVNGIGDYRLIRSLKYANIKATKNVLGNQFSLAVNRDRIDINQAYLKLEEKAKVKTF